MRNRNPILSRALYVFGLLLTTTFLTAEESKPLRILNFQDNNGYKHASMPKAKKLLERLGEGEQLGDRFHHRFIQPDRAGSQHL